jgi:hypothetical protein
MRSVQLAVDNDTDDEVTTGFVEDDTDMEEQVMIS